MDLVLRASATPEIGSGHVMRGAALAEAWLADGIGRAILWGEASVAFARRRLESLGVPVVARWVPLAPAVLLCDAYDRSMRADGATSSSFALRVLVDDLGGPVEMGYDAVWNPNAYGTDALYPGFTGAILAGAELIPLRGGLPRWCDTTGRTAVMLGGTQLDASLIAALGVLSSRTGSRQLVGAGTWVPRDWGVLPTHEPWSEVARAACLVTSSGVTVWEAAFVGIPAVVVRVASNQDRVFEWATAHGVPGVDALGLAGDAAGIAMELERAIPAARPLPPVGNGAPRVVRILRALAEGRVH